MSADPNGGRERPRDLTELERMAEIRRTEEPRPTLRDAEKLERKFLRGRGRRRRKMSGWPR